MQTQDALKLLIEAVNLAQSRGAYNLKEASTILQAVETFTNNQNNTMNEEQVITEPAVEETPVETTVENTAEVPSENVDSGSSTEVAGEAETAPSEPSA